MSKSVNVIDVIEGPSGIAFALMIADLNLKGTAKATFTVEYKPGQPTREELTLQGADIIDIDNTIYKFGVVDSVFETLVFGPNTGQGKLI